MSLELAVLAIVPLALFVFAEWKYGLTAGIYAALFSITSVLVYWYWRTNTIDETLAVEAGLMFVMGGISLRMKDSRYFKFQPTMVDAFFVIYILYFQLVGDPFLGRIMRTMAKLIPDQLAPVLASPNFDSCMWISSWVALAGIAIHGVLVTWAAIKFSSFGWLLTRLSIIPILIVVSVFNAICVKS